MKKTIVAIVLVLSCSVSQAQFKVQSSFGISTYFTKDYGLGLNFINILGLEFEDKVGIEYGYSYKFNNDPQSLTNYLYGNSNSWTAAHINHLLGAYYKFPREEGSSFSLGGGASILTTYTAEKKAIITNKVTPYFKVGLDQNFGQGWGGQINLVTGNLFAFTLGVTKEL
jgi:hypothetical protein